MSRGILSVLNEDTATGEPDVIRHAAATGYPRTLLQAKALGASQHIDVVVNLDVPFDVIRQRLEKRWIHKSSGRVYHTDWSPPKVPGLDDETGEELVQRDDDKPETVQWRLKLYDNTTKPLIDYYKHLGLLHSFTGNESNVIYPRVKSYVEEVIQAGSKKE